MSRWSVFPKDIKAGRAGQLLVLGVDLGGLSFLLAKEIGAPVRFSYGLGGGQQFGGYGFRFICRKGYSVFQKIEQRSPVPVSVPEKWLRWFQFHCRRRFQFSVWFLRHPQKKLSRRKRSREGKFLEVLLRKVPRGSLARVLRDEKPSKKSALSLELCFNPKYVANKTIVLMCLNLLYDNVMFFSQHRSLTF